MHSEAKQAQNKFGLLPMGEKQGERNAHTDDGTEAPPSLLTVEKTNGSGLFVKVSILKVGC